MSSPDSHYSRKGRQIARLALEKASSLEIWEKAMGGFGSGRRFGRPTVEESLVIDLAWMLREGLAKPGANVAGHLTWSSWHRPIMQLEYKALMATQGSERLEISGREVQAHQVVKLSYTTPNFGGKRWWMLCPYRGSLANKLYLPPGGDQFASRQVHRLSYRSERATALDRALERMIALQARLGCSKEIGAFPVRPKGMWSKTFECHLQRYRDLRAAVGREICRLR
jgi:hypothetical protein